mgnify:CR=1 FL=1
MTEIRFRTIDRATLEAMLTTLYECLGAGTASIAHNGNTVSYSSPSQIRATIVAIEAELDRRDRAAAAGARRSPLAPQYPIATRGWS